MVGIQMYLPLLKSNYDYVLPEGYSLKMIDSGFKEAWLNVMPKSDNYDKVTEETFDNDFSKHLDKLSSRMTFLFDDQKPIGTATNWMHDDMFGKKTALVHWVGILPEYKGKRLATPLIANLLNVMAKEGNEAVLLNTGSGRVEAINLYAKFGFRPVILTKVEKSQEEQIAVWEEIKKSIRPKYLNEFEYVYI